MKKLYVGNLKWDVTEQELAELFSQVGETESVKIITDQVTGRSRGFAFVEMKEVGDVENAITHFHGKDFKGRALTVNEARPKTVKFRNHDPSSQEGPASNVNDRQDQFGPIRDFCQVNAKVGDEFGFTIDGKHFTIVRDS